MIELPNSIRRRLEVLTAVGLATVSTPTAVTASAATDGSGSKRTDEVATGAADDGGERRGR
ncbi:hypothetical protein [Haloterrigena alkaliphila]|uniref:Uncharacterized protein n=1 Tax=Haloterrigena alkaliphila TaxID=2816475 RepID=A0A8A2VFZ2_9EURY|nr:hypothetical protein [Haloterrigena alkaliphila]QSW99304.1 hypothetical protein J0X25_18340 [Haloterrigena alkaliphila]